MGCCGPKAASRIARARRYKGSAAATSPWACNAIAKLFKLVATSGCCGPKAASAIARARRNKGSAAATSPWA